MVIDVLQEFNIVWSRHNFSSFFLAVKKKTIMLAFKI